MRNRVSDPDSLIPDPDPAFRLNTDPDPGFDDQKFTKDLQLKKFDMLFS